ncbi:MAG: tRNA (adenosine(37)-N6)-threonylcarbamoyltransferase complex transferase subunit TsaD [candidate division Zixibacteria bacterium]|nr:tRNA (adenosine(37)-N6)-threonylcarbamoyltransferase complex transferase subunit TsaD [candidate division Zixibacteria bacterium]
MLILGIETSCDETSAAITKNGRILSNVIYSQLIHTRYGGVVPEIASRQHIKTIIPIVQEALNQARTPLEMIEGIAVTYGPGLVGCLLVGISWSKALAYSLKIPLIGINHIEAHIFANFLEHPKLMPPFVCLVVSGGHTLLVNVKKKGGYQIMGQTRDDAAGEAFDKVAKLLEIGYPGGPLIDKISKKGKRDFVRFPRAYLEKDSLDFSFSGPKTAVAIYLSRLSKDKIDKNKKHIAASFQEAVVDVLIEKGIKALSVANTKKLVLAGGVARNSRLREKLEAKAKDLKFDLYYPSYELCTDNAAMVAACGEFYLSKGMRSDLSLNAIPYAKISSI